MTHLVFDKVTISVIIPLTRRETCWQNLVVDLEGFAEINQIVLVGNALDFSSRLEQASPKLHWINAQKNGRGAQMNLGAIEAKGEYLWFLHADSRLKKEAIFALIQSINNYPKDLLYFNLKFLNDSHGLVKLNAQGANFRSKFFNCPFGDQGFCLSQARFEELDGFREDVAYGEDHLLVWQARQAGMLIRSTGSFLYTSARKYRERGWLKTTLQHQYLWIKQVVPSWYKTKRKIKSHVK